MYNKIRREHSIVKRTMETKKPKVSYVRSIIEKSLSQANSRQNSVKVKKHKRSYKKTLTVV